MPLSTSHSSKGTARRRLFDQARPAVPVSARRTPVRVPATLRRQPNFTKRKTCWHKKNTWCLASTPTVARRAGATIWGHFRAPRSPRAPTSPASSDPNGQSAPIIWIFGKETLLLFSVTRYRGGFEVQNSIIGLYCRLKRFFIGGFQRVV